VVKIKAKYRRYTIKVCLDGNEHVQHTLLAENETEAVEKIQRAYKKRADVKVLLIRRVDD